MSNKHPVEIDHETGEVETLPPQKGQRYRCKLDTLADVKREMAKVYRESRNGLLDYQDSTKAVWVLERIGKIIEVGEIEKRLEALEAKQ